MVFGRLVNGFIYAEKDKNFTIKNKRLKSVYNMRDGESEEEAKNPS
jgi:hypothetical protein